MADIGDYLEDQRQQLREDIRKIPKEANALILDEVLRVRALAVSGNQKLLEQVSEVRAFAETANHNSSSALKRINLLFGLVVLSIVVPIVFRGEVTLEHVIAILKMWLGVP
jgi:hypothetical protein